jgi:hypothetical protein
MTLIKKQLPDKKSGTFDVVFGIAIVVIVLALVAIFCPMLIMPFLR